MSGDEHPEILMESIVAFPDFEPFVALKWGDMAGQLSAAEARQHALRILETAEAAEHDSALCRFNVEDLGIDMAHAAALMRRLRVHRGSRRD